MARNTSKTLFCNPLLGDREKPGAKEGGGADFALLCPARTAVTLDTSMGTEAEAIQSSPRFFLVSGDGSGLRAVDSAVGRIGSLACWEHYNPLARYALMADGEQIHSAMYPGSFAGDVFSEQISVNIRQHALGSRCFVVNSTAWLDSDQQARS